MPDRDLKEFHQALLSNYRRLAFIARLAYALLFSWVVVLVAAFVWLVDAYLSGRLSPSVSLAGTALILMSTFLIYGSVRVGVQSREIFLEDTHHTLRAIESRLKLSGD